MADDETTPQQKNPVTWIALMPMLLPDVYKQCLELIEQGAFDGAQRDRLDGIARQQLADSPASWIVPDLDADELIDNTTVELENRELITSHGEHEYPHDRGTLTFRITDDGRRWLKRCHTEGTSEYELVLALFNSLDEVTQRRFAAFAAERIGMKLHPDADA
jgi:hypothetical protein